MKIPGDFWGKEFQTKTYLCTVVGPRPGLKGNFIDFDIHCVEEGDKEEQTFLSPINYETLLKYRDDEGNRHRIYDIPTIEELEKRFPKNKFRKPQVCSGIFNQQS